MHSSVAVDSLEILVIVDNVTDSLSTNPPWVEPEWRGLLNRGRIRVLSGPGMFSRRGTTLPSGIVFPMAPVPTQEELVSAGANVICTDEPQFVGQGFFYVSGEIPRVTPYEKGLVNQVRRLHDGADWEPDPLVLDERYVSVNIKGRGQFIFSACSHAGIINVLKHARKTFSQVPPFAIMGGLHLSGLNEAIIPETIADMEQFGLQIFAPGHCTGWRAISAMERTFKDKVVPLAVGKRFLV